MAKAKLHAADGTVKSELELPAAHFGQEVNEPLMYQAIYVYLSNQRQGTHKTKGRSEVSGGGKKPWKQKGTGNARQGSNTAPNWARGGKAHGPMPHKYSLDMTSKSRRRALTSALSLKAKDAQVHVFEKLTFDLPKTKALHGVLTIAELEGKKNLILVDGADNNLLLAARNLPNTKVQRVQDMHTYEILNSDNIIFTASALGTLKVSAAAKAEKAE